MNRDPDPYRIYMVVRNDLNMTAGKMSAQASHGALDTYLAAQELRPETIPLYKQGHGIKVCLKAKNEYQLEKAQALAIEAGIPCALITDLGYTVFEGQPTVTVLGLGPAKRSEINHIVKRFQLME